MVDVNKNLEEINKVEEIRTYLLKSSTHFGGSKFTKMINGLSNEEQIEVFNEDVLRRLERIADYDVLASVFRVVPSLVQEKMWESNYIQKILLGMETVSDEKLKQLISNKNFFNMQELSKKDKQGRFCYTPVKLRALEVLIRYIKNDKIKEDLHYNQYFHMIMLCSKKVPDSFYTLVDVEKLFYEIVNSDIYRLADGVGKRLWLQQINGNFSKLLLPYDYTNIFEPTVEFSSWYYERTKNTLGAMLHSKIYNLYNKGLKLDVDLDELKKLNLCEINELKNCVNGVVDQELVDSLLRELVEESIKDGTIMDSGYLKPDYYVTIKKTLFKLAIDMTLSSLEYEGEVLEYLYNLLFTFEYNDLEKKAIMMSLKNSLLNSSTEVVADLFNRPNDLKSAFFLRFNLTARDMSYLSGIDVRQLLRLNVKHVNKIVQLLYDPEQDELSDSYSKAIKMYLVFGLERTLELLSGKYPVNKIFLDNVSKLDVTNVEMKAEGKKYLPVNHEEFNRFLFVANNINALFDEDTAIHSSWYYLYNNFETIKDLCKGHVNLGQAEIILKEQVNKVSYDLEPDCYRLEKVLYEVGLGNKGHYSNEEVYDEMCKIHKKQVRRVQSTIPYVKGTLPNGWGYEVMKYDDAIAYVLGYKASCCIRVKDIAHNHLLHALLCENGRILLTYKPDGSIASFSPLKRNGEVLIANSIEAIDKEDCSILPMTEAFRVGMEEICRVSKKNEENNYIKVATIGSSSVRSPKSECWPINVPTPTIYEKDDPVYCDTDCYHKKLHIFYKDDKANLSGLKYGKVEQKYFDPRKDIIACTYDRDNILLQRKSLKRIDSIRYTKHLDEGKDKESFEKTRLGYFDAIFCNDDWYVIVDFYGLHYDCLDDDPRARKEMEATIEVINEYSKNKDDLKRLILQYSEKKA